MTDLSALAREWLARPAHNACPLGWKNRADCDACVENLTALLQRVRDEEREACAAVADDHEDSHETDDFVCGRVNCSMLIAAAIRARGGKA